MFTPLTLRGAVFPNRVVVAPVLTYRAADDGMPGDFHLVHYGARTMGGAGLVMVEMCAVAPEGRTTPACPGLWSDAQAAAWARVVTFAHAHSPAMIGVQIGHAGARGSVAVRSGSGERPLTDGAWPLIAASARAWAPGFAEPRAMDGADMDAVRQAFVAAAVRAAAAGFDVLEIQAGHGTLLAGFLMPVMNRRDDGYGGSLDDRLRYPLTVVAAVRAVWPGDRPLAVRISAHDWMGAEGAMREQAARIAAALVSAGADLIDVSSGETSPDAKPVFGRMYQAPFSDRIRNEVHVPTITAGNIYEPDHVNSILAAGRADLVALGRPHLADPAWTMHAAAALGYRGVAVPPPYRLGHAQLCEPGSMARTRRRTIRGRHGDCAGPRQA